MINVTHLAISVHREIRDSSRVIFETKDESCDLSSLLENGELESESLNR